MQESLGLSILNSRVLAEVDKLREEFTLGVPFPHIAIDDFLAPDFAQQLLGQFPGFEQGNFKAEDGSAGGKSTLDKVRSLGPAYRQLDDAIKSPEFLKALSRITGIDDLIYDPWYLGGGTHESRNGVSLDPHVDFNYHPSERWHRRLNVIIYLNPDWEAQWGGSFELFRDPHASPRPDRTISPVFNRCAIFATSEHSWHGFDAIQLPEAQADRTRRSIALYFYTKDRPTEEVADPHTVFYVKRQLPEHFAEGHVLSAEDAALARDLIAQRDGHIRLLYAENTALRKAQDAGLMGNLLYFAKRAFVRYRR